MMEKERDIIRRVSSGAGLKSEVILSWDVMDIQGGGEKTVKD